MSPINTRTTPGKRQFPLPWVVVLISLHVLGCTSVSEEHQKAAETLRSDVKSRAEVDVDPGLVPYYSTEQIRGAELLADGLSEDDAVKLALLNNREVRRVYEHLGMASADLVKAGLLSNPVFQGNAKFFSGGTEIEWSIAQSFFDVLYLPLRRRVAEFEFEAARLRLTREIIHLIFEVRRAMIDHVANIMALDLAERRLAAESAALEIHKALRAAGNQREPAMYAAELAVYDARLAVLLAAQHLRESREPLNRLMGLGVEAESWIVSGLLPEGRRDLDSPDQVLQRVLNVNLDLLALRAEIAAAAEKTGLENWQSVIDFGELGLAAKKEVDDSEFGFGPEFAIELPIFDTGQSERYAALSTFRDAVAKHVVISREVESAVRILVSRLHFLDQRRTDLSDKILPLAEQQTLAWLREYNAMQTGPFAAIAAETASLRVRAELNATHHMYWRTWCDLQELESGKINLSKLELGSRSSGAASEPGAGDH